MLAPFDDPSWEIWACSASNTAELPRSEAWFELHDTNRRITNPKLTRYYQWLQGHPNVYMQKEHKAFKGSVVFPRDEVLRAFGWPENDVNFFTSSIAWMFGKAIVDIEKKKDPENVIGMWGIDMAASDEYDYQRAGCHYFIGEARRRGIKVYAPPESDILTPYPMYGYQENSPMWRKFNARGEELDARIAALQQRERASHEEMLVLRGAREGVDYALGWTKTP